MLKNKTKITNRVLTAVVLLVVVSVFVIFVWAVASKPQNPASTQAIDSTIQPKFKELTVADTTIQVELAITDNQKSRGLCCQDSLPEDQGMLFVYDQPGDHRFWMKDTKIPLDMLWINAKKNIVHIEHSVQPSSYPKTFSSPTPAQYILETNAGFAKKHHIQIGELVSF